MKKNRLRNLLYVLLAFGICIGILMPTVPVYAAADTIDGYVMDAETLSDGTIGILFIRGGSSSEGVISGSGTLWYAVYDPSGRWTETPVISDETVAKEAALAIHDDVAHIAYTTADDKIAYTYQTDTGWAEATVIESNNCYETLGTLYAPDIVIGTDDSVHISYFDTKGGECEDGAGYPDVMHALVGETVEKTVLCDGWGWFSSPDGNRLYPLSPDKITQTDSEYIVAYSMLYWERYYGGSDTSYYVDFKPLSGDAIELNDDWKQYKVYEACAYGSTAYVLGYGRGRYAVIQCSGGGVSVAENYNSDAVGNYAADMTLDDDGYIYYAAASGSNILFHQNGTPVTGTLENSIHSNHNKLATVLSDGVQYAIYTNTEGKIVVANPDGEDVNEVLPIGKEPEDASTVDFTATGYDTGIVSGLVVGEPYTIQFDDDEAVEITPEDAEYELTDIVLTSPDESTPASTILTVIKKATNEDTMADSVPRTFTITRADTPDLEAMQPAEIDGTGSIPTTEYHEYTTDDPSDEDTEWIACLGELSDLEPGTYYVRVAAAGTVLTSDPQEIEIVEYDPPKETTPSVTFTATGTSTATLSGLSGSADDQYTLSGIALGEASPYTVDGTVTELTGLEPGTLSIIKNGNLITTIDSDAQTITITRAQATVPTYTHPTESGENGLIETDATYEYTTTDPGDDPDVDGVEWTACTGALPVPEGTYYLRIKADGTALASETRSITLIVPSYYIYDGDNNEIGAYREWSEVTEVITSTDNSGTVLKVKIAEDLDALNNFKFPKSAKSITFVGAVPDDGDTVPATVKYSGDLTLTCDTTFEDLYFEHVDANGISTGAYSPVTLNMAGNNLTFAGDAVVFDTPLNINDASKKGTVKFSESTSVRACGADNEALSEFGDPRIEDPDKTLAVIEGSITNVAAVDLGTPLALSDYPAKADNTAFTSPVLTTTSLVSRYPVEVTSRNAIAVLNDDNASDGAKTAAQAAIGKASATIQNLTLLEGTTNFISSGIINVTDAKLYAESKIKGVTIQITDLTLSGSDITIDPTANMTVTGTAYIQALSEVEISGNATLKNIYIINDTDSKLDAFIAHPVLAEGATFAINGTVTAGHAGDKLKIGLSDENGDLLDIESRQLLYTTTQKTISGLIVPWLPGESVSPYTATFIETGSPNKVYAGRPSFCLYDGDDNEIGIYENWADAANLIASTNNSDAVLKVKITEDVAVFNNFKFPKAAKSILFMGEVPDAGDTVPARIQYSGNISLTCDTVFEDLIFEQVDARGVSTGPYKPMTINMAGHNLTFGGSTVAFDTPVNINDSAKKGTLSFAEDVVVDAYGDNNEAEAAYSEVTDRAVLAGSITNVFAVDTPDAYALVLVDYPSNAANTSFAVPTLTATGMVTDTTIELITLNAGARLNDADTSVQKAAQKANGNTSVTVQDLRMRGDAMNALNAGTVKVTNAYLYGAAGLNGNSIQITNLSLFGENTIYAVNTMSVTGTLTSYTEDATIITNRDPSGKKAGLNISGTVVLADPADMITIRMGEQNPMFQQAIGAEEPELIGYSYEAVYGGYDLDPVLGYTGLLLDAKSADVSKFKLARENQHKSNETFEIQITSQDPYTTVETGTVRGEYSDSNTGGYILVKKGTGIYVFYGDDIVVDVRDASAENIGYYVSWAEAVSAVNARKDKQVYTFVLLKDVGQPGTGKATGTESISLPNATYTSSLVIDGGDHTIYQKSAVTASYPIWLKNVTLTNGLTANAGLTVIEDSAVTVNGALSAKNGIVIEADSTLTANGTVTVSKTLVMDGDAVLDTSANNGVAVTIADIDIEESGNEIKFARTAPTAKNPNGESKLKITGAIYGTETEKLALTQAGQAAGLTYDAAKNCKVTPGAANLIASIGTVPTGSISFTQIYSNEVETQGTEFVTVKQGGNLYLVKKQVEVEGESAVVPAPFNTSIVNLSATIQMPDSTYRSHVSDYLDWAEMVKEINNINMPATEYQVNLLEYAPDERGIKDTVLTDTNAIGALSLPGVNKASKLTVTYSGTEVTAVIYVTGNISGYGQIVFEDVQLLPVKGGNNDIRVNCGITVSKNTAKGLIPVTGLTVSYGDYDNDPSTKMPLIFISPYDQAIYQLTSFKGGDLTLTNASVTTTSSSTINKLSLKNSDYNAYAQATITDVEVQDEAGEESFVTATLNTSKPPLPQFTINGAVTGKLYVKLISYDKTNKVYVEKSANEILGTGAQPLALIQAPKALASSIVAYKLKGTDGIVSYQDTKKYIYNANDAAMLIKVYAKKYNEDPEAWKVFSYARSWNEAVTAINNANAGTDWEYNIVFMQPGVWQANDIYDGEGDTGYQNDSTKTLAALTYPKATAACKISVDVADKVVNAGEPAEPIDVTLIFNGKFAPLTDFEVKDLTVTGSVKDNNSKCYIPSDSINLTIAKGKKVIFADGSNSVLVSGTPITRFDAISGSGGELLLKQTPAIDKNVIEVNGKTDLGTLSLTNGNVLLAQNTVTAANILVDGDNSILARGTGAAGAVKITDIRGITADNEDSYHVNNSNNDELSVKYSQRLSGRTYITNLEVNGLIEDVGLTLHLMYPKPTQDNKWYGFTQNMLEIMQLDDVKEITCTNDLGEGFGEIVMDKKIAAMPKASLENVKIASYGEEDKEAVVNSEEYEWESYSTTIVKYKGGLYVNGGTYSVIVEGYANGFEESDENPVTYKGEFLDWKEAVSEIDRIGSTQAGKPNSYVMIDICDDIGTASSPVAFTLPSKAAKLYLFRDGDQDFYTSSTTITLKTDTVIDDFGIYAGSMKNGEFKPKTISFSLGSHSMEMLYCIETENADGEDYHFGSVKGSAGSSLTLVEDATYNYFDDGVSGVTDLYVEYADLVSNKGVSVTNAHLYMGGIYALNETVSGTLTLDQSYVYAYGTDKKNDGFIKLNNMIVKSNPNMMTGDIYRYNTLCARQNANGTAPITISGTVTDVVNGVSAGILKDAGNTDNHGLIAEGKEPVKIILKANDGSGDVDMTQPGWNLQLVNAKLASDNWFGCEGDVNDTDTRIGTIKMNGVIYATPVYKNQKYENGQPVFDENNQPVYEPEKLAVTDVHLYTYATVVDESGNIIPDRSFVESVTDLPGIYSVAPEINTLNRFKKLEDGRNSKFYEDYEAKCTYSLMDTQWKNGKLSTLETPSKCGTLTLTKPEPEWVDTGYGEYDKNHVTIRFAGPLSLKCNLVIDNALSLWPVTGYHKANYGDLDGDGKDDMVTEPEYGNTNCSLGNFSLTFRDTYFSSFNNVTGTSGSHLKLVDSCLANAVNVNVGNLDLMVDDNDSDYGCSLFLDGNLTVNNINVYYSEYGTPSIRKSINKSMTVNGAINVFDDPGDGRTGYLEIWTMDSATLDPGTVIATFKNPDPAIPDIVAPYVLVKHYDEETGAFLYSEGCRYNGYLNGNKLVSGQLYEND